MTLNMTRFSESFWNLEFCNFAGFDILCKRMKDGKQMTKDYADFLKLRTQAQETYGKALMKIAKMIGGREEIGTLRQSWEVLRIETENIGQAHVHSATVILDEMNKILEFMETQREQRRKMEENVRRTQTSIKALYKKAIECKKTYELRTREADQVIKALAIEKAKTNSIPKDVEKLKAKHSKTVLIADQADACYKSAIDGLENARQVWEQETETACDVFQQLEEDRIQCLRNSMWVTCNIGSANCVLEDERHEEVRRLLEKCDADSDIHLFIQQKQTGSKRPAHIEYENYFGGQTEKNENQVINKNAMNLDNVAPLLPKMFISPAKPVIQKSLNNDNATDSVENEALYDSIYESATPSPVEKKIQCKVVYDFEGRNDEELTLQEDEIVTLLHKENSDWWEVETEKGIKGYFPATYLELT